MNGSLTTLLGMGYYAMVSPGESCCVIVETERLLLRKWNDEDAVLVAHIYAKPEVMEFIPGGAWNDDRTARAIARMRELDKEHGFGFYPIVLKSHGKVIGHCGLGLLEQTTEIEVAYILDSPFWGQGLASEAARAMLDYAFSTLNIFRVVAVAFPKNVRSIGVMRSVGMTPVGPARHFGATLVKYEKTVPQPAPLQTLPP
ncbi:MAG: GNAT family N-acetyltransferase [Candidatus Eremiobacteraeota bacterium]|nr:GNAT family N-acetyltransferase [Candidatus Eremiobacteraeota bacterium]